MNLRQRFAELIEIITKDIPEREYYVQLGFLTALIQEPFYLYGRPGCGSSLFIRRISSAFKDARILKLGKKQRQLPDNINDLTTSRLTMNRARTISRLSSTITKRIPSSSRATKNRNPH